jgi:PAS domain S-box-containing protein
VSFVCSWSAAGLPMLGTMDRTALRWQSVSGAGRPRPDGRALSAWIVLAGLGSLAGHFALSRMGAALAYDAPAAVAIVLCVAAWRYGDPRRAAWLFLAAGTSASVLADLVYSFADSAFPGPADVAYVASYPLFAVALLTFVPHRRAGMLATLLDAALATVAISLFVVVFWLEPLATAGGESLSARVLSCAYPVGDLLLVAIGMTVALQSGRRHALVLASMATLLVSDLVYYAEVAHNSYVGGDAVDAGWMCAYTLLALAGAQGLRKRAVSPDTDSLGWRRLILAGIALFAVPAAAAVEIATGRGLGSGELIVWGMLIALLSCARMLHVARERSRAEQKFRTVFDRAGIGISIGKYGAMTETNPAFQRLVGYTADELSRMHYSQITHPDDMDVDARAMDELLAGRTESCTIEKRYVRSDGAVRWVRVTVSATPTGGFDIGLIEDITDRRRLLARTVEAAERERLALAADLHDGPVQHLTATAFTLDLLVNRLTRESSSEAAQLARRLRDDVATEMTSLRRMMTGLRPPVIDARGVDAAIHDTAATLLDETDTRYAITSTIAKRRFAPEVETAVFRIAREAIANIRNHAQAANADIRLDASDETVTLAIEDDGVGLDGEAPPSGRYGLITMRERAESLGGTLVLTSGPERGTLVQVTLPFRSDEPSFS